MRSYYNYILCRCNPLVRVLITAWFVIMFLNVVTELFRTDYSHMFSDIAQVVVIWLLLDWRAKYYALLEFSATTTINVVVTNPETTAELLPNDVLNAELKRRWQKGTFQS